MLSHRDEDEDEDENDDVDAEGGLIVAGDWLIAAVANRLTKTD